MLKVATKFAPTDEAMRMAVAAGFANAEFWTDAQVLADWQRVAALARDHSLRCVVHFPNRHDIASPSLQHAVDLYRELGCRAMVIHEPHFDRYGTSLLELEPELCLAIENHRLSLDEWHAWCERSEYLTLDVEHTWKFTLEDCQLSRLLDKLRWLLDRHGSKLKHVHLPGYLPGYQEHRPMYAAREMIFPVLDLLAEAHFEGLIVSEIHQRYQNPNDLRMDVLLTDTWRHLAEERLAKAV